MTRRIFCKILLVVIAVFGLLVISSVLSAQGNSEWAFERAREAQEGNSEKLMAKRGVVGTAIGLNDDGKHVVLVLLEESGITDIPTKLNGIPVRTIVTGKFYALVDTKARFDRPVPTGVSTGHPDITAGTIGCRVTDGTNVYALSNNHVYANINNAQIGDSALQPGPWDGGMDTDYYKIGELYDFEPIDFSGGDNTIDAAIAKSTISLLSNATPADGYGVPKSETVRARLFQNVKKYGRTTGFTEGYVAGVNAIVEVCYNYECTLFARFVKQIIIGPAGFSDGGDSGSLIVRNGGRDDGKAVGLLFAGNVDWTIANPIQTVLDRFGVTIDDSEEPPPPENNPPTVTITSPVDGSNFGSGVTISFAGTASDTEDDDAVLTDALAWTSSINGSIGTGGSCSASLSDGTHTITAEVTDSGGKTGSASISITVGTPAEVSVTGINPVSMPAGTSSDVTISGSGFAPGANVTFENGSGPAPKADVTSVVDGRSIEAMVTAHKKAKLGILWDVRVTNPDGSTAVLIDGFEVTQ